MSFPEKKNIKKLLILDKLHVLFISTCKTEKLNMMFKIQILFNVAL